MTLFATLAAIAYVCNSILCGFDDQTIDTAYMRGLRHGDSGPRDETMLTNEKENGFIPTVRHDETEADIMISVEVPGFSKDDITVVLEGKSCLVVSGERKNSAGTMIKFSRRFVVNKAHYDLDTLKGDISNGILDITLSKMKIPKGQTILITSNHALDVDE